MPMGGGMQMLNIRWRIRAAAAALMAGLALAAPAASAQTLRAVMQTDLKILDPIWTTAYTARNHGYMVYDTLFGVDAALNVKPQMLETWTTSDDKLVYTFILRDGLKFHDGQPVTAEDCIASIRRWSSRDAMGQKLMSFVKELTKAVLAQQSPDSDAVPLTLRDSLMARLDRLGGAKAVAQTASVIGRLFPLRFASDGRPDR